MAQQPKPRKLDEWLQAKLEDNWGGDNIAQLLTLDQVTEIAQEWEVYESSIRVKILIAILNMRKKQQLNDLKEQLEAIIAKGHDDPDEWVRVMAYILDGYVETRQVNLNLKDAPGALVEANPPKFLPLEVRYLNPRDGAHEAAQAFGGDASAHFTLRNPPKAQKLWQELEEGMRLASSSEARERRMSTATRGGVIPRRGGVGGIGSRSSIGIGSASGNLPGNRSPSGAGLFSRPSVMGMGGGPMAVRRQSSMTPIGQGIGAGVGGAKRYMDNKRSINILEADESLTLAASSVKRKKTDEELKAEEEERLAKRKQKEASLREEKERKRKEREQLKEQRKVEKEARAAEERRKSIELRQAAVAAKEQEELAAAAAKEERGGQHNQSEPSTPPAELPLAANGGERGRQALAQLQNFMQQVSRLLFALDLEPLSPEWDSWHTQLRQLLEAVKGQFMQCEDIMQREVDASIHDELAARLEQLNQAYDATAPKLARAAQKRNQLLMQQQAQMTSRVGPTPQQLFYAAPAQDGVLTEQQQVAIIASNPQLQQTFSLANKLTPNDRSDIIRFIQGDLGSQTYNASSAGPVRQIVMHEDTTTINGQLYLEQIVFEMDYERKTWKRLKRKKPIK